MLGEDTATPTIDPLFERLDKARIRIQRDHRDPGCAVAILQATATTDVQLVNRIVATMKVTGFDVLFAIHY